MHGSVNETICESRLQTSSEGSQSVGYTVCGVSSKTQIAFIKAVALRSSKSAGLLDDKESN